MCKAEASLNASKKEQSRTGVITWTKNTGRRMNVRTHLCSLEQINEMLRALSPKENGLLHFNLTLGDLGLS